MPQPFRHLRPATSSSRSAGGISVVVGPVIVVGSVLVGFLADDVVVPIEMYLELVASVAGDLDLVDAAGAVPIVSISRSTSVTVPPPTAAIAALLALSASGDVTCSSESVPLA